MTNSEQTNPAQSDKTIEQSSDSLNPNMLLALKILEYLFLATFVGTSIVTVAFPQLLVPQIYVPISVSVWLFLFLIERQFSNKYNQVAEESELSKIAELHTSLAGDDTVKENNSIALARRKALRYCQELIQDYKNTRRNSRNIYYTSQIGTIVLSGVTPILVLVDKLEPGIEWIKWLPVICPAIAAIVASIVTSFPFQESWVAANTAVELLEAEQEKFVLGVTPLYNYYDTSDGTQLPQKAQRAVENFIIQVNNIHLKQLEATTKQKQQDSAQSTESNQTA